MGFNRPWQENKGSGKAFAPRQRDLMSVRDGDSMGRDLGGFVGQRPKPTLCGQHVGFDGIAIVSESGGSTVVPLETDLATSPIEVGGGLSRVQTFIHYAPSAPFGTNNSFLMLDFSSMVVTGTNLYYYAQINVFSVLVDFDVSTMTWGTKPYSAFRFDDPPDPTPAIAKYQNLIQQQFMLVGGGFPSPANCIFGARDAQWGAWSTPITDEFPAPPVKGRVLYANGGVTGYGLMITTELGLHATSEGFRSLISVGDTADYDCPVSAKLRGIEIYGEIPGAVA